MTEKNQHTPGPQGAHGSEDEIQAVIDRILAADDARRASEREATGRGSADSVVADHEDAPTPAPRTAPARSRAVHSPWTRARTGTRTPTVTRTSSPRATPSSACRVCPPSSRT